MGGTIVQNCVFNFMNDSIIGTNNRIVLTAVHRLIPTAMARVLISGAQTTWFMLATFGTYPKQRFCKSFPIKTVVNADFERVFF